MILLLLAVIYLAFISLGLPDSILGSVWPVVYPYFDVPLSYAGIVSMLVSLFTIASSLCSDWVTRHFGTGRVVAVSVLLTAGGLFGYSVSTSFPMLLLFTLPYGLGAGAIDAALNNYVALHYSSRHMSWLHCFWGVGTIISPYIVSAALRRGNAWQMGYRMVSFVQLGIAVLMIAALPLWKRVAETHQQTEEKTEKVPTFRSVLRLPGVKANLLGFFGYCALEATFMLWTSTYFVQVYGVPEEKAAAFAALGYGGITLGRFLCGFVAERLGDKRLIRLGETVVAVGILLIALPLPVYGCAFAGFLLVGLGCAPIYPSIVHATPLRFGKTNSQIIIGMQMSFAYTAYTLVPLLFGLAAEWVDCRLLPVFMIAFLSLNIGMLERVNRMTKDSVK